MLSNPLQRLAAGSIAVALVVLGFKTLAWWLSGSVALYSDAVESIVNVVAALVALLAVRIADRPADRNHPFGHHKAEYIAAVVEGALITVAAYAVLKAAWFAIAAAKPLDAPLPALVTNGLASVINAAWGWVLVRAGRQHGSPALLADGRHLLADVASSVGVLLGLVTALATGLHVLDAVLAGIVGGFILWAGWRLVAESLDGLMDRATPPDVAARLREVIAAHSHEAIEVHDIRTRRAGRATFIEFHLVVDGQMSVAQSHGICDRLETAIAAAIDGAITTIHVEPEHKRKLRGSRVAGHSEH
ncbi:MAG: cation diffusion facilitator family transporter [Hyphomicrobiaceae bacterium]